MIDVELDHCPDDSHQASHQAKRYRRIEIIMELQDRNSHLLGVVATLKRVVYGPRSEKLLVDVAQLRLALNARGGQ